MNKSPTLPEGLYCMIFETCVFQVRILMTMTGQSPDRRESLLAHFESGFPRFPMPVAELLEWGAKFEQLQNQS